MQLAYGCHSSAGIDHAMDTYGYLGNALSFHSALQHIAVQRPGSGYVVLAEDDARLSDDFSAETLQSVLTEMDKRRRAQSNKQIPVVAKLTSTRYCKASYESSKRTPASNKTSTAKRLAQQYFYHDQVYALKANICFGLGALLLHSSDVPRLASALVLAWSLRLVGELDLQIIRLGRMRLIELFMSPIALFEIDTTVASSIEAPAIGTM